MRGGAKRVVIGRLLMASVVVAATGICGAHAEEKPKAPPSIWEQDTLTGDWGGARTALKDKGGIDFTLNYIGESFCRAVRRSAAAGELRRTAGIFGR